MLILSKVLLAGSAVSALAMTSLMPLEDAPPASVSIVDLPEAKPPQALWESIARPPMNVCVSACDVWVQLGRLR